MARQFVNRTIATSIIIAIAAVLLSSFIAWLSFFIVFSSIAKLDISRGQQRNTLNISREQYNAALAKWNNLHVTDYEATVQVADSPRSKIVVHVDNDYGNKYDPSVRASYSHRIVECECLNREAPEFANLGDDFYQFVTVGGLFDDVNDDLYCQENSCKDREFFLPSRYVVEFDQTLGYPRSVTSINEYATVETRIENLKILKSSDNLSK